MYREFIEHPWSIPDDIHARLDLRSGSDRGRIYRLAPSNWKPQPFEDLGKLSSAELVSRLSSSRSWVRETAQRLIVERADKSIAPQLAELVKSHDAHAVVHALWTLHGIGMLKSEHIAAGLSQASPHVIEQAIRLAEPMLASDEKLFRAVVAQCEHSAARVRLQAALSLGNDARAVDALARLAIRDGNDTWMRAAIGSAEPGTVAKILSQLVAQPYEDLKSVDATLDALVQASAAYFDRAGKEKSSLPVVQLLETSRQQPADTQGRKLEDVLWRGLFQYAKRKSITLHDYFDEQAQRTLGTSELVRQAERDALDSQLTLESRQAAIARLTLSDAQAGMDRC